MCQVPVGMDKKISLPEPRVQRDTDSCYIDAILYGLNKCLVVRLRPRPRQMDKHVCL